MRNKLLLFVVCLFWLPVQAQEMLNYPLDTVNGEEVYQYQVERSIGLYRIGVNFNVPQSEIVRFNPQLRERGLHYGETLLIPTGRPVVKRAAVPTEDKPAVPDEVQPELAVVTEPVLKADTVLLAVDTVPVDSLLPDTLLVPDTRKVIELALMLPFESQQTKRSTNAERMLAFYQGALLALHDLQNDSTLYRLRVYDTERSERRVKALCDTTEMDSVKAVLGLVYPIQIERMANWCEMKRVPLLLPFSDDVDLVNRPYVLQFNSTDQQEADSLCAWIKSLGDSVHCTALDVRDADLTASIRTLRKAMRTHDIPSTKLALRDLVNDSASYALDSAKENILILHSDRYQHVRILLPHIQKLQEAGFKVRIVSQYSWQKENITLPQVYTSMFTTVENRDAYEMLWRNTYANEPVNEAPRYDLLGYDLMRALVAWLNGEKENKGLQSTIYWQQIHEGGWQNTKVGLVIDNRELTVEN